MPFNAGGGSDVFTRIFQKAVRDEGLSPQALVVRNVGGAGGTIGSRMARDAKPDGYTIMCLHDGIYTAQHYGNADWGPADFEPIAATGRSGVVIAVAEGSSFETLTELMDQAVARPYELVFGTNLGAPNHYSALFVQQGKPGAKFRFTQSGGGSARLNQLKGGHVDVTGFSVAEYVQYREAGIRALAVLSNEREPALPDLPTALEQGVNATHSLMQFWWAPKGTKPERLSFLVGMLGHAMEQPYVKERLRDLHIEPVFLTDDELQATLAERGSRLNEIALDDPPPLPPLEWIVLGLSLVCGLWVWRESTRSGNL
ncbi:MAG: tripartite tricarboxylate transporter substrate binding protein [Verrucomicrobiota bacterium]